MLIISHSGMIGENQNLLRLINCLRGLGVRCLTGNQETQVQGQGKKNTLSLTGKNFEMRLHFYDNDAVAILALLWTF